MREKIKLESSAGTGHFYTTTKNKKTDAGEDGDQEVRSRRPQARHVQGNEAQVGAGRDPEARDGGPGPDKKSPPIRRVFLWGYAAVCGIATLEPGGCAGLRVALQLQRELRERHDARRLGALAPVLQPREQLLGRFGRALPQRGELLAHRVDRRQRAALRPAPRRARARSCSRSATDRSPRASA